MKEKINVFDYAELIDKAIHPGVLLNTNGDKFNSMVIGWGHLGVIWGINTFVVYVRQSRYTKAQIDKTMEFTISVPMGETKYPKIFEVCGTMSGRDVNKADYVTLEEPATNHTPGIREYPLTDPPMMMISARIIPIKLSITITIFLLSSLIPYCGVLFRIAVSGFIYIIRRFLCKWTYLLN